MVQGTIPAEGIVHRRLAGLLEGLAPELDPRPLGQAGESLNTIRQIEELRMQLVSSAMGLLTEEQLLAAFAGQGLVGTVVTDLSGVSSTQLGEHLMAVFLPTDSSDPTIDAILAELNSVYERTSASRDWIIDFSSVQSCPLKLWGALMMFETRLRFRQRRVRIAFLRSELVPAGWLTRLSLIFSLKQVGGQYFSEA